MLAHPAHMPGRLLVVDDEPSILRALRQFLSARGYEVHTASSLEQAQEELRTHRFEVVVTDLELTPGRKSGGFDLLDALRQSSPGTPAILLTAYRTAAVDARAGSLGVALVLDKPVPLPRLADEIGQILA